MILKLALYTNKYSFVRIMEKFFEGSFSEWKARKFDPPRLRICENTHEFELSAAAMKSMTYNTQFEACRIFLAKTLESNWLSEYIKWSRLDESLVELCLLIAESGECTALVQKTLRNDLLPKVKNSRSAAKPHYLHALARVLGDTSLNQFSANQAPCRAIPQDPPKFLDSESMWQWHLDFAMQYSLFALLQHWKDAKGKVDGLGALFFPLNRHVGDPIGRVWLLTTYSSQFNNEFEGELVKSKEVVTKLKAYAAKADPIFGKSLSAAAVFYRQQNNLKNLALCRKLDPLEHLSTSEIHRYLTHAGADVVITQIGEALTLKLDGRSGSIIFPKTWLLDSKKRLEVFVLLYLGAFDTFHEIKASSLPLPLRSVVDPSAYSPDQTNESFDKCRKSLIYSSVEVDDESSLVIATQR